jgi:hypothetical protein
MFRGRGGHGKAGEALDEADLTACPPPPPPCVPRGPPCCCGPNAVQVECWLVQHSRELTAAGLKAVVASLFEKYIAKAVETTTACAGGAHPKTCVALRCLVVAPRACPHLEPGALHSTPCLGTPLLTFTSSSLCGCPCVRPTHAPLPLLGVVPPPYPTPPPSPPYRPQACKLPM